MTINKKFYKSLFLLLVLILLAFYLSGQKGKKVENQTTEVEFSELPGWAEAYILPVIKSFEHSCRSLSLLNHSKENEFFKWNINKDSYLNFCEAISEVKNNDELKLLIEDSFYPAYLSNKEAHFTGYVELEIKGRLEFSEQEAPNAVPILKMPANIITVDLENFGDEFKGKKIKGLLLENDFVPVPSRKIIENENMFKEHILAYIDNPSLAYFLHIQGSGVITLPSGEIL